MKKRGYTLVELIAVMSIIAILATVSITGVSSIINIKNNMELDSVTYEIRQLLSMAKKYCRTNRLDGKIIIIQNDNKITFNANGIIKSVNMPEGIKIKKSYSININKEGYITDSLTITIIGYKGEYNEISIGVGNDIITVKD